MEDFDKTSFYTIGAFDNSYSARKILDYSLADKAKADKDAMDAAIADGESREEAPAQYLTDERISRTGIQNSAIAWSVFEKTFLQTRSRACLKNHSRNLHAPLCGIFCPNSVAVARYGAFIWTKSPTNCDAHLAESLFQTRSGTGSFQFTMKIRVRQNIL